MCAEDQIKQLEAEIERLRMICERKWTAMEVRNDALDEAATVADGHSDYIGDLIRRLKEKP